MELLPPLTQPADSPGTPSAASSLSAASTIKAVAAEHAEEVGTAASKGRPTIDDLTNGAFPPMDPVDRADVERLRAVLKEEWAELEPAFSDRGRKLWEFFRELRNDMGDGQYSEAARDLALSNLVQKRMDPEFTKADLKRLVWGDNKDEDICDTSSLKKGHAGLLEGSRGCDNTETSYTRAGTLVRSKAPPEGGFEKMYGEGEDAEARYDGRVFGTPMHGMMHDPPPGGHGKWYAVTDRRFAKQVRDKAGYACLKELEESQEQCLRVCRMNVFPTEPGRLPSRLVITNPPDLALCRADSCFRGVVCGIDSVGDNMACTDHKDAQPCGGDLKVNDVVFVNGRDCHLVGALVYYLGVYRVKGGELQPCRVGVLKVWYDNLRYFCNRTAQVTYVVHKSPPRKGPKKRKVKEGWEDSVNGRADIVFIDWPMFMNREYKVGEKKVGLVGMATKGN